MRIWQRSAHGRLACESDMYARDGDEFARDVDERGPEGRRYADTADEYRCDIKECDRLSDEERPPTEEVSREGNQYVGPLCESPREVREYRDMNDGYRDTRDVYRDTFRSPEATICFYEGIGLTKMCVFLTSSAVPIACSATMVANAWIAVASTGTPIACSASQRGKYTTIAMSTVRTLAYMPAGMTKIVPSCVSSAPVATRSGLLVAGGATLA